MKLKLLSKWEVDKARQEDRAKEIAEGLKIAKRVDSLRELLAKTEMDYAKFREESLKAIQQEINQLLFKKEELIAEIKSLQETKNGLLS